jgi:hypothetical protein
MNPVFGENVSDRVREEQASITLLSLTGDPDGSREGNKRDQRREQDMLLQQQDRKKPVSDQNKLLHMTNQRVSEQS